MQLSHEWKMVAIGLGALACGAEGWMNAEHIAHAEGWASSLVATTLIASASAAASLPLAERAWKASQQAKAVLLIVFFLLMASFALSASIARVGGKHDSDVSTAQGDILRAQLAEEAHRDAKQGVAAACTDKTRGSTACNKAQSKLDKAREALVKAPAPRATANSMADRITAVLPVTEQQVRIYQPLLLPLALQIGGFVLLALGLAPGRPEPDIWSEPPAQEAEPIKLVAKDDVYRWLIGQIHQAPKRQLDRSGRAIAEQLGLPPSTFAKWVADWVAEKKIIRTQSGNSTVWSLPKVRRVA